MKGEGRGREGGEGERDSRQYYGVKHDEGGRAPRERGATGDPRYLRGPLRPYSIIFLSTVNAYIVAFVNGELSEGHLDG